jgi:hypothetical protein
VGLEAEVSAALLRRRCGRSQPWSGMSPGTGRIRPLCAAWLNGRGLAYTPCATSAHYILWCRPEPTTPYMACRNMPLCAASQKRRGQSKGQGSKSKARLGKCQGRSGIRPYLVTLASFAGKSMQVVDFPLIQLVILGIRAGYCRRLQKLHG